MIDDVHWGDGESRDLIAALLPRLTPRRILLVTSARPDAEGRLERPDTVLLVLEPLGPDQVALLLASAGALPAAEWAPGLARALHRSTLGSPLLIVETLSLALSRDLLELKDGQWSSADPVRLYELLARGGALHQRIVDLSRERRWLLTLLAVAGVQVPQPILADAVRRPEAEVVADLDELNRHGLAVRSGQTWAAGHDAIAERLMEMATPEQSAAAHAALGRALVTQPDDQTALRAAARHLAAGGLEPETAAVAARWVRLARGSGDRRSTALLVSDLLGSQVGDPSVRRTVRALPLAARVRGGSALAAGLSAAAVLVAALLALARSGSGDPGLLVGQWRHESSGEWRLFAREVSASDLAAGHLALASLKRTNVISPDRPLGELRPGSPSTLLTGRAFRDSGGEDIVLGTGERFVRLTRTKGDDYEGSWSPDGKLIAFSTDRWSNASQSAIAVLDPMHPDSVRRLTAGGATRDVSPRWSPDGARIAFTRTHILTPGPSEMCVVSADGTGERCLHPVGLRYQAPVGWANPLEMVGVLAGSAGGWRVVAVNVESGVSRPIAEGAGGSHIGAAGWAVCYCRRAPDEPAQLLVLSTTGPERALRLEPSGPPEEILLHRVGRPAAFLDRLTIVGGADSIPGSGSWQLGLKAWDASGRPREPMETRWWSSDTLTATADSTGQVRPRRTGRVWIHATAGGWRTDSISLRIYGAGTTQLLTEDWRAGIVARWVPFGTPRPYVAHSDRGPALAPNGDSTFTSGVYTRRLLPMRDGLGVEFDASVPLTATQWQSLEILILPADSFTTRGWDLVKGQLAIESEGWSGCEVIYPEGFRRDRVLLEAGMRKLALVPAGTPHGAWTRYRLQFFPDGRCGLAVNGEPLATLERVAAPGDSAMLLIMGYSFRTRILVGHLEVWTGVREDLDWTRTQDVRR